MKSRRGNLKAELTKRTRLQKIKYGLAFNELSGDRAPTNGGNGVTRSMEVNHGR